MRAVFHIGDTRCQVQTLSRTVRSDKSVGILHLYIAVADLSSFEMSDHFPKVVSVFSCCEFSLANIRPRFLMQMTLF